MKLSKGLFFLIDAYLLCDALIGFASGNPFPEDYIYLIGSTVTLIAAGGVWISQELRIRKKMKELQAERNEEHNKS